MSPTNQGRAGPPEPSGKESLDDRAAHDGRTPSRGRWWPVRSVLRSGFAPRRSAAVRRAGTGPSTSRLTHYLHQFSSKGTRRPAPGTRAEQRLRDVPVYGRRQGRDDAAVDGRCDKGEIVPDLSGTELAAPAAPADPFRARMKHNCNRWVGPVRRSFATQRWCYDPKAWSKILNCT
jgi:hypothetical protein